MYSHILDEDRKVNAQKFEVAFYSKPDLRDVRPPVESNSGIVFWIIPSLDGGACDTRKRQTLTDSAFVARQMESNTNYAVLANGFVVIVSLNR